MTTIACKQTTLLQWHSTSDEYMELPTSVPRQPKRRRAYCKVRFMSTKGTEKIAEELEETEETMECIEESYSSESTNDLEVSLPHNALLSLGLPSEVCGGILEMARTVPITFGWFDEIAILAPDDIYMSSHFAVNGRGAVRFHILWDALREERVLNRLKELTATNNVPLKFNYSQTLQGFAQSGNPITLSESIHIRDIETVSGHRIFLSGLRGSVGMCDILHDYFANPFGFFVRIKYRGSPYEARRAVERLGLDWVSREEL